MGLPISLGTRDTRLRELKRSPCVVLGRYVSCTFARSGLQYTKCKRGVCAGAATSTTSSWETSWVQVGSRYGARKIHVCDLLRADSFEKLTGILDNSASKTMQIPGLPES